MTCRKLKPSGDPTGFISRFIANSSTCTTTELSILLTSCLTALKSMSLNIAQQFMKEMVKIYFGLLKIQVKFLIN